MELSSQEIHPAVKKKPEKSILLNKDIPAEKRKLLFTEAKTTSDEFVDWAKSEMQKIEASSVTHITGIRHESVRDKLKHLSSKRFLVSSLAAVGLYDIGLSLASEKLGIPQDEVRHLWRATVEAPMVEETIFRSRLIPNLMSELSKISGSDFRSDTGRLFSNIVFTIAHTQHLLDPIRLVRLFGSAGLQQKVANERGFSSSVVLHAIHNATSMGIEFLHKKARDMSVSGSMTLETRRIRNTMEAVAYTAGAVALGMDILGLKEILEDHRINDTLSRLRKAQTNDGLDIDYTNKLINRLVAYPATDGYKFKAGTELAYKSAWLEYPILKPEGVSQNDYAMIKVREAVAASSKNPKEIEYRVGKAVGHIENILASTASRNTLYYGTARPK